MNIRSIGKTKTDTIFSNITVTTLRWCSTMISRCFSRLTRMWKTGKYILWSRGTKPPVNFGMSKVCQNLMWLRKKALRRRWDSVPEDYQSFIDDKTEVVTYEFREADNSGTDTGGRLLIIEKANSQED